MSNITIHETAVVEDGAQIGAGTSIWHHAHVRSGAVIGGGCVLGKSVFVDSGAQIGDRCKVQNNVSVYNGIHLADEVFVGPSAVFTNDRFPRAQNPDWELVETHVGQGASISANATIRCGVTIGEWAVVGAGSMVTKDVAPHEIVAGNPARHFGWACRCGRVASTAPDNPESEPRCERHAGR